MKGMIRGIQVFKLVYYLPFLNTHSDIPHSLISSAASSTVWPTTVSLFHLTTTHDLSLIAPVRSIVTIHLLITGLLANQASQSLIHRNQVAHPLLAMTDPTLEASWKRAACTGSGGIQALELRQRCGPFGKAAELCVAQEWYTRLDGEHSIRD